MKVYADVVNVNVQNLVNIKIAQEIVKKNVNIMQVIRRPMDIYAMQNIYARMNAG